LKLETSNLARILATGVLTKKMQNKGGRDGVKGILYDIGQIHVP